MSSGRTDVYKGSRHGHFYVPPAWVEAEPSADVIIGTILICQQFAFNFI